MNGKGRMRTAQKRKCAMLENRVGTHQQQQCSQLDNGSSSSSSSDSDSSGNEEASPCKSKKTLAGVYHSNSRARNFINNRETPPSKYPASVTTTGRDNNGCDEEDIVSVLNENSSVQVSMEKRLSGLLEKMRELEEGMTNRRDIFGEASIVSASTIIRPENEEFMKECLRKFVAKNIPK
jgi:hypothetical protein